MSIDLQRFRDTFFEEAAEHLATIEAGLLTLEESGAESELLHQIFRAAHSIKGAAGSFGFTQLANLTHALENLLDRLRSGTLEATPALSALLLRASDALRAVVDATREGDPERVPVASLVQELERAVQAGVAGPAAAASAPATPPVARAAESREVCVTFAPFPEFFLQGQDPLLLLEELAQAGEWLETRCDDSALPALEALDPERCAMRWTMRLRTERPLDALRDVFLFVDGTCDLEFEEVGRMAAMPGPGAREDAPAAERRAGGERRAEGASIRVSTEKVDALINLVGELVIAQAMVSQALNGMGTTPQLEEVLAAVQRGTRELQEQIMGIRMLPVATVFQRFPRLVRDLGQQLGKRVRLELTGAETELDKGVLEQLGDPLTHLVRNAVDHGLEGPEARAAAGKAEEGVVRLRAYHEGGNVILEVADDGKGLDRARVLEKAVAQGLVRADAALNDEQIGELIFLPGFSTAKVVSDVSGRGVGMDVVKRNVEALNGAVSLTSTAGAGSCVRIRLPLTLAILDGLSVRIGREVFIVPLLSIRQSVRPAESDVHPVLGGRGEVFMLRGEQIPLVRMARLFHIAGAVERPVDGIVIVVETDGQRCGLLVDDVLGQQQVVVKNIEKNYRRVEAIMGATILGDGRVAFIADVNELQRLATRRRPTADRPSAREGLRPGAEELAS